MQELLRLSDIIDRISTSVAAFVRWGLLSNALLITANAVSRKLFGLASPSAFDLQWHFFAAVVLLMAAYTLKRDEHVRVDVFASRFGDRGMAWLDLFGLVIVLIPVCLAMTWISWPHFVDAYLHGQTRASRESTSDLPAWIMKGFIPLAFLLLALQGIAEAIHCVASLRGLISRPVHRRQLIDGAGE